MKAKLFIVAGWASAVIGGFCIATGLDVNRAESQQEALGRTIVMAARGWQEWPTEPALPLCEWDRTGNYYLVTPCASEEGLISYRSQWVPRRWSAAQQKDL